MKYQIVELNERIVVGLSARTSNQAQDCSAIIGGLWGTFLGGGIKDSIRNQVSDCCIGLYSDYDTTSYDVTVGLAVTENANPELTQKLIPGGTYAVFSIEGDVVQDVAKAWEEIWSIPLDRSYVADFEEYLENNNGIAKINIYISLIKGQR